MAILRKSTDNIYNVVVTDGKHETTLTYSASSKFAVSNFAKRDLKGKQKIVSIEQLKPEHGKLLLSRQEVADIFGVSCQTISNYVSRGILKVSKVSEKNSIMFDRDMVETIRPVSDEIQACLEKAEAYKDELGKMNETAQEELDKVRASVGIDVSAKNNIGTELLKSMTSVALGDHYSRMYNILIDYLQGKSILDISVERYLTTSRVYQIISKAVSELNKLRPYAEVVDELNALKAENERLKWQVSALQTEIETCPAFEPVGNPDDEDWHLYELFKTRLSDMNISTRTLKCLENNSVYDVKIETIGDLIRFNRSDMLKIRNFGKKSLTELDDMLDGLGLYFGSENTVDRIRKKFIMNKPE